MILKSFCKVNLFLEVLNHRDDGYHNIDTLFQAISLSDSLKFEESDELFLLESNVKELNNPDNLISRAFDQLKPFLSPNRKGVKIILSKNIPMGAGLGGGSSNAATTLVGLNRFYQLNLSDDTLIELGSQLGADVPFFIKGGIARGEGIGDKLTFFNNLFCPLTFLIVFPQIHLSTKEAYEGLTLTKNKHQQFDELIKGIYKQDLQSICKHLYNQFEETQFQHHATLKELKKALLQNGAAGALMSGSGSSIFGIFESKGSAEKAMSVLMRPHHQFFIAESITGIE